MTMQVHVVLCHCRGLTINTCFVVRHLSPSDEQVYTNGSDTNGAVVDGEAETAKRPTPQLKVALTGISQRCHVLHFVVEYL